jgi:hypothetical protein
MTDDFDIGLSSPLQSLPATVEAPDVKDLWVGRAVSAVEAAIDELADDFRRNPFVHRVEHSLHVQLFGLLMQQEILRERHRIGKTTFVTGLIHKEWPETQPRKAPSGDVRRRGSFDLAVLAPSQLEAVQTLDQFIYGTIAAPIVIELGLGYQDDHLVGDETKVLGSQVQHPYLVHFSRIKSRKQQATEAIVNRLPPPIKVVYVHHDIVAGKVRFKHLNSPAIEDWTFEAAIR